MTRGPVEVLALAFPLATPLDQMAATIKGPVDSGHLSVIDLVLLLRNADGTLEALDAEHDLFPLPDLAGMTFDPHTLLSDDDVEALAMSLNGDQQGLVAVVEHVWARTVTEQLHALGAEVLLHARVLPDDVDAAYAYEDANA